MPEFIDPTVVLYLCVEVYVTLPDYAIVVLRQETAELLVLPPGGWK